MPKEIEILPPLRTELARPKPVTITARVPGASPSGAIDSYFAVRRYNYTTKKVDALTRLNNSEASLFNSQKAATVTKHGLDDALFELQCAPERRAHELALKRMQRSHEIREMQHHREVQEIRRMKEVKLAQADETHAKATLNLARVVLKDSEQQYDAQVKYGAKKYEIRHLKENLEQLDLQLEEQERRALIRDQIQDIEGDDYAELDGEIDEMLGLHKDSLEAAGLDTSRVDRVLNRRRPRSREDEQLEADIEEDIEKVLRKK
jgi:hypothetical protein